MKGKVDFELPQEVLGLYRELTEIQERHSDIQVAAATLSSDQKQDHLAQGVPILSFVPPTVHQQAFVQVTEEVCEVVKKYRPNAEKKIDKILDYLRETEDYQELFNCLVWQEENKVEKLIVGKRLDKKLFFFILINSLRPFMISYGKKVSAHLEHGEWKHSYCPVCGWEPIMAKLTSDGHRRLLHCSMCGTEWEYKRLACINCGNQNHETLRYFSVEGDEAYQVAVCEECKSYLKTVDESKSLEQPSLLLADIKTLYLDILAEREGYVKEKHNSVISN